MAHEELKKQYAQDVEKYENPWVLWSFRISVGEHFQGFVENFEPTWNPSTEYHREREDIVTDLRLKVKGHPHAELMTQYAEDAKTVPLFPTDEIVRELKQQFGIKDDYGVMMWYTDFISRIAIGD